MAKNVLIFGTGIIGSEAKRQFAKEGYRISATVNSKMLEYGDGNSVVFQQKGNIGEIYEHLEKHLNTESVHLAVLALPSGGPNAAENEWRLMQPLLDRETPMVLAGKAAFSEHYEELRPDLPRIGRNATVGGATKILAEMKQNLHLGRGRASVVELVLNGTLSYIMSNVWAGRPLEAVIRESVALKFAEPGINRRSPDPFDVFKGEAEGDIPKKVRIILQDVYGDLIGRPLSKDDLEVCPMTEDAMMRFTASNARRKYVVRISTVRLPHPLERNSPGSIWGDIDNKVFLAGGFYQIPQGSPLDRWVPNSGPGNAVCIEQNGHQKIASGEGAGDLATVGTLIDDARELCPP